MAIVPLQFDEDGIQYVEKDPDAQLDFLWDWAALEHGRGLEDWLQPGEVIVTHTLIVPAGINLDSDNLIADQKAVLGWFSGGTICEAYDIVCRITTNQARTDDLTGRIKVKSK